MSLSLLATVDIMTLSFCFFVIIMLIEGDDGPKGPPPATPGPAIQCSKPADQIPKARVSTPPALLLKLQVPSARSRVTAMMILSVILDGLL